MSEGCKRVWGEASRRGENRVRLGKVVRRGLGVE